MQVLITHRIQARANRLANFRLHRALAPLSHEELHAARTGFFPSIMATLNHILGVDEYYIGVLHGQTDGVERWASFRPADTLAELAERQRISDERLIAWLDAADDAALEATVQMPRGGGRIQRDAAVHMLAHLLMHQTHHRGQVHTMMSGTHVAPPQLDEFLMPSEGHLRAEEMAALGWSEAAVYGGGH
jgi:uncharacterized damage-inducible protein DinB